MINIFKQRKEAVTQGHDSRAIANIFVEMAQKSGDRLTIMPLIKYVFFAHGWTLGNTREPLICHKARVWQHGPVIPEVYYAFRPSFVILGKAVDKKGKPYSAELTPIEQEIVEEVYEKYSVMMPWDISNLTHEKMSPWSVCKRKEGYNAVIPDDIIMDYYAEMVPSAAQDGND